MASGGSSQKSWHDAAAIAAIVPEVVIGTWLCSGFAPAAARAAAMLLLAVFAGVSGAKALQGEVSCGCFGDWRLHPWISFAFDILSLAALQLSARSIHLASPRRQSAARASGWRRVMICMSAVAMIHVLAHGAKRSVHTGQFAVGEACEVCESSTLASELRHGDWTVVFHRRDCAKCDLVVQSHLDLAAHDSTLPRHGRTALIECSGLDPAPAASRDHASKSSRFGRLTDPGRDAIRTPCVVTLARGIVTDVVYP